MRIAPDGATVSGDEEFPVNNGALCVKGWTSAELLNHPDRLLRPLKRNARGVLAPVSWDEAFKTIAEAFQATQAKHGRDAVGVLGGGSLTNEKAYLLGKFARVALRTANIDYNGRFCMSSAAAASVKRFRHRSRLAVPGLRRRPRRGDSAGRRESGGDDAAADAVFREGARERRPS